jgi:hypothetical protein
VVSATLDLRFPLAQHGEHLMVAIGAQVGDVRAERLVDAQRCRAVAAPRATCAEQAPVLKFFVAKDALFKGEWMAGNDVIVPRLREMGTSPAFQASDAPCLIVDRNLIIRGVNAAYQSATMHGKDELHDRYLFDAFPDNPHDPAADGVAKLGASLERVLRARRRDRMLPQRYDIPHPRDRDRFVTKVWLPVNSPIVEGDQVIGVVHHVEDITDLDANHSRSEVVLTHSQRADIRGLVQALTDTRDVLRAAQHQVEMLQIALETNRDIGAAIGILMYEHKIDREAAWNLLRAVSQQTNHKVRDVALKVIEAGTLS